jgi:hypothetical protein
MKNLEDVPYSERIVLLPQCLRSNNCTAKRKEYGIIHCEDCKQERDDGLECQISEMTSIALDIGYRNVLLFAGASGIINYLSKNGIPNGVLAVACPLELKEGLEKTKHLGIPTQIEGLIEEGCAETTLFNNQDNFKNEWIRILTKYPPKNGI